jgi:predicted O-methyltransferase YrrM
MTATELDLSGSWSIGERAFEALCGDARAIAPSSIVEFGSGPSSVRLALAFPDARVFSVDHSPEFGGSTIDLVARYSLSSRVEVSIRPLSLQVHGGALYQSYRPGPFPASIDVILVDGPPEYTRRGREASLHQAIRFLRVGGRIYLDDYQREGEKQTVRNWELAYPGAFRKWVLPHDHEVCVLEKIAPTRAARPNPLVLGDVTLVNLARGAGWAKRKLDALRA